MRRKGRKMTVSAKCKLSIANITSALLLPLLLLTLLLLLSTTNELEALKLPSLFTWWQPTTSSPLPPSATSGGASKLISAADEPMLTSASSGIYEHHNHQPTALSSATTSATGKAATGGKAAQSAQLAQQQQQQALSSNRKPFQHMLMLPGKHNHLFSALPKSLFARLLTSQQSTQAPQPLNQVMQSSSWQQIANSVAGRPLPIAHFNQEPVSPFAAHHQSITDESRFAKQQVSMLQHQQVLPIAQQHFVPQHNQHPFQFQLQYQRPHEVSNHQHHLTHNHNHHHQQQQQQQQAAVIEDQKQKKHALGFGENEDFVILDPQQVNNHEQQQQQQVEQLQHQQLPFQSTDDRHQEQPQPQQQQQQQQQQQFKEVPALLISEQTDNEPEQQEAVLSGSRFVSESGNQTVVATGAPSEQQQQPQSAELGSNSNGKRNSTESNANESARSEMSSAESTTLQSNDKLETVATTAIVSGQESSELNKTTTTAVPPVGGAEQNNSSSILTTLINDELTKLKREPEVLNKTLNAMTQPLVDLFLESTPQVNESSVPGTTSMGSLSSQSSQPLSSNTNNQSQQQQPLDNPDSGQLESSSAAIIVSPGDGHFDGSAGRMVEDQLSALSDDQIESFIIGPYKGLTSDNLSPPSFISASAAAEQVSRGQFRDEQSQQVRNQQQQPYRSVLANIQAAQGNLGMSSMASNLIQQAKSLIQIPFAHLANNQQFQTSAAPTGGVTFRGQQQMSNRPHREPLLDQSSSPPLVSTFRHEQQQLVASPTTNNYRNNHLQQQQPFYKQTQSTWPPVNRHLQQSNQQQQQQQQFATSFPQQQQPLTGRPTDNRYFLRPSSSISHTLRQQPPVHQRRPSEQQQPTGVRKQEHTMSPIITHPAQVPYFLTENHHSLMGREPQRHHVNLAQQFQFLHQPVDFQQAQAQTQQQVASANEASIQHHLYAPQVTTTKKTHPINELAQQQQRQRQMANPSAPTAQHSDFHLIINHNNNAATVTQQQQQQQRPPATFHLDQSAQTHQQQQQQQQQQPVSPLPQNEQSAELNAARKYRSGLYQIDPPKLKVSELPGNSLIEQQQQQVSDSDLGEADEVKTGAKQESISKDVDEDDADEADDEHEQQVSTTESPPAAETNSNQLSESDFSRQVGATIGVSPTLNLTHKAQRKGQVFSEPLGTGSEPISEGTNLTQVKKLKFTQDVTLYDFEVPSSSGGAQSAPQATSSDVPVDASTLASGLNSAHQQPAGVSLLDTQVYTVPYTFSVQPNGRAQLAPQVATSYSQPPVAFSQPPSPPQQHQHQQQQHHHFHHLQSPQQQQVMNLDRYQPTQRQVIHQAPFAAFNQQVGRFPLQYLAPPSPQPAYLSPEPNQQQQQQDFRAAQSNFKSLFQDYNLNQFTTTPTGNYEWNVQQPQVEQQVREVDAEAARQHYFHYQPVATLSPPRHHHEQQQQQQHSQVAQVDEVQGQNRVEQGNFFDATPSPQQAQQFVLAIRHGSDQVAPNGAALFANSFSEVSQAPPLPQQQPPQQQQQQHQQQQVHQQQQQSAPEQQLQSGALDNQLTANQEPDFNRQVQSNNGSELSSNQQQSVAVNQVSSTSELPPVEQQQQQQQQREENAANGLEDNLRQQPADRKQVLVGSSPSAFCADRLPGLYADESQRCRAYYQCAPTGHQMFRCNNQTQFNQKTQNCDWWYNVNCGGRLGSLKDFEQAATATSPEESARSSGADTSNAQQADREVAASNSQESTGSVQVQVQQQQQQPLSLLILADEQSVREAEEQQAAVKPNRWSTTKHSQEQQQQEADVFHHSDSLTNITVAPDSLSRQVAEQQEQQQQQQLVAPSSTPSYSRQGDNQESASSKQVEFADRTASSTSSATNQEAQSTSPPITGNLAQDSQQQQQQQQQPQVGAFLTSGDEQSSSSSATQTSGAQQTSSSISQQDQQSTTLAAVTTTTTTAATTTAADTPTSDGSPAASRQQSDQQQQQTEPDNGKRRLVQSEFGLGVKQAGKSARSTARFQFTRHPPHSPAVATADELVVGVASRDQHPTPNHKYALEQQQQQFLMLQHQPTSEQLYSTSANQGSVSYVPSDTEEHFRLSNNNNNNGRSEQVQVQMGELQVMPLDGSTGGVRAEKRFGARLPNSSSSSKEQIAAKVQR